MGIPQTPARDEPQRSRLTLGSLPLQPNCASLARGDAVAPADAFLRYRFDCEASPNTLRAYAYDLKLFFGILAERSLGWRELSPAELGEFVAWLRRPAGNVLLLPGTPPARAASTVDRAL